MPTYINETINLELVAKKLTFNNKGKYTYGEKQSL